ncbi:MAG: YihY/virulence factor BrkB family protein [Mycobacteriaceae bacterium]
MSHPAPASTSNTDERGRDAPTQTSEPDSPTDLTGPTKVHILRRTLREFSRDQCTDLAAALTYYAVLALFPAVVALLSLIGLVGKSQETVDTVLSLLRDAGAGGAADSLKPTLTSLSTSSGAIVAFIIGIAGALWSASGYVNAFSRSMNSIYNKAEGRPVWKLRPAMLAVTVLLVVLVALVLVGLVVSGPVASAVGSTIGLGSAAVTAWSIAKWPVMLVVVVLIVAILYYATPNVKPPKFRWISLGAVLAILVWVVASALFGFYVANFSSYNKTYGAFAGVVVFLLWLWITNVALLFGAELDAELERGRELQAGKPAEEEIQLPHRDETKIDKDRAKDEKLVAEARAVRSSHGEHRD